MDIGNDEMQIFAAMHFTELLRRFVAVNQRPDGRPLNQPRALTVAPGPLSGAAGSVLVGLGATRLVAGCSVEPGPPTPTAPGEGRLQVSCHFPAPAADFMAQRRAREKGQSIATWIRGLLLSTKALDLTQLCPCDGPILVLRVDVVAMSDDGNLADASLAATMGALRAARFPRYELDEEGALVPSADGDDGDRWALTLRHCPASLSFGLFDKAVLQDCTLKEEQELTGWFAVAHTEHGGLCGVYKPGGTPVDKAVLKECIAVAKLHALRTFHTLRAAVPDP